MRVSLAKMAWQSRNKRYNVADIGTLAAIKASAKRGEKCLEGIA